MCDIDITLVWFVMDDFIKSSALFSFPRMSITITFIPISFWSVIHGADPPICSSLVMITSSPRLSFMLRAMIFIPSVAFLVRASCSGLALMNFAS